MQRQNTETAQNDTDTEPKDVVYNLFQTVYNPVQYTVFIVLIMVLVICIGMSFLAFIGSELVSDFPLLSSISLQTRPGGLTDDQLAMIFAAFFGAYLFAIQELVRRYNTFDLLPQVYSSIFVRMIVATGIVAVGALFIGEQTQGMSIALVVAFLIGTFPQRGIDWLTTKVRVVFDAQQRESSVRPLTDIIGISPWHEARLREMGIDDAQNLATADLRKLLLTTQFDPQQIVNWIDQAILYVKMGPQLEGLRANHITTFYELYSTVLNLRRMPPLDTQASNNADLLTDANKLVRDLKLTDIDELRRSTDPSNYPNFVHIEEYYVRTKRVVQRRAAAGAEVLIGVEDPYLAIDIQESGEERVDVTELQETINQLERQVVSKPSDPKLWLKLGYNCHRLSSYLALPEQAGQLTADGQAQRDKQRKAAACRAKQAFDQVIEMKPNLAEADLTEAYLRRAALHLNQAEQAQADQAREDYTGALRDSNRALQLNPGRAIAYTYRGRAQAGLGYRPLAEEDFSEAIRIDDRHATVYFNRGTVRNAQERFAEAVEDFHSAYLAGLRTPNLLANWGKALIGLKKYDLAIKKLSAAIVCDPTVADFYSDRGLAYMEMEAYPAAESDLRTAIKLNPKRTGAAVTLGTLWIDQEQFSEAVNTLRQELKQTPDTPYANAMHYHLARALTFNKQYAGAIDDFKKALELGIGSRTDNLRVDEYAVRLSLAAAYKGANMDNEYQAELEKIVAEAPKDSEAYKHAERLRATSVMTP